MLGVLAEHLGAHLISSCDAMQVDKKYKSIILKYIYIKYHIGPKCVGPPGTHLSGSSHYCTDSARTVSKTCAKCDHLVAAWSPAKIWTNIFYSTSSCNKSHLGPIWYLIYITFNIIRQTCILSCRFTWQRGLFIWMKHSQKHEITLAPLPIN